MNRTAAKAVISAALALTICTGQLAFAQDNSNRGNAERSRGERGAGPKHEYYPGDRLPAEYRERHNVVNDWRGHRLSAPPSGHHWVQSGGDYILIAINTGVIAKLLLSQ